MTEKKPPHPKPRDPLDHDGDGRKGGAAPKPPVEIEPQPTGPLGTVEG